MKRPKTYTQVIKWLINIELNLHDEEWADKIIYEMPTKCPLHQCGGFMKYSIRKKPKNIDIDIEGYDGDEQSPDLICTNCKAVYQFKGFKEVSK